jgi:hypothetical protein
MVVFATTRSLSPPVGNEALDQFSLKDNMDDADLNAGGEEDEFMDDAAGAADDVSIMPYPSKTVTNSYYAAAQHRHRGQQGHLL